MTNQRPVKENALCVVCPGCSFTFDSFHTNTNGGGYTCPVCSTDFDEPEEITPETENKVTVQFQRTASEHLSDDDYLHHVVFEASDEEVGPACSLVRVPRTIADDEHFREIYCQGWRHALAAVREDLRTRDDDLPLGWAVALSDADDGWELSWDDFIYTDRDEAVEQLREASRTGYFCNLVEVRIVASQPALEPPTLYEELYNKFRAMKFSHLVSDDLAERAAQVAEEWHGKNP